VLTGDARTCMEVVGEIYRRGMDIRRFCQQLCDHFRNILFVALGGQGDAIGLELPAEEIETLRRQAAATTPDSVYLYFQTVLKGEEEIRRSSLPRISLEMLLLRLSQQPKLGTLDRALATLKSMERRLAAGGWSPAPIPEVETLTINRVDESTRKPVPASVRSDEEPLWQADVAQAEVAVLELGDTEGAPSHARPLSDSTTASVVAGGPIAPRTEVLDNDHWPSFVRWLAGAHPRLAAKLSQSRLVDVSETEVRLEVMDIFAERFQDPQVLGKLKGAAADYFGRSVVWKIGVLSPPRGETVSPAKAGHSKVNSRRLVMENTVVQQALEILGGELLDIKKLKKGQKESP